MNTIACIISVKYWRERTHYRNIINGKCSRIFLKFHSQKKFTIMKKLFYLLAISMVFTINSCQKSDLKNYYNHHQNEKSDANVALDWYKLQLRILLERNSALNGVYFAYIGIGLYESVRNGTPGAVSLSARLFNMPEMPA